MNLRFIVCMAMPLVLLCGCQSRFWTNLTGETQQGAAAPLPSFESYYASGTPGSPSRYDIAKLSPLTINRQIVGFMRADAITNSQKFLNSTVITQDNGNFLLDLGSTAFNAAATVVSPLTAAHQLTAGAAVTTGTEASLNQDYFDKSTNQEFALAIANSFGKDMQDYGAVIDNIPLADDASIVPSVEYSKIQSFLGECALGPAYNAILTTLAQSKPSASTQGTEYDIAISATPATATAVANDTATLTPDSNTLGLVPLRQTLIQGETAAQVAGTVATYFNANVPASAGITATVPAGGSTIKIIGPAGAPSWQLTFSGSEFKATTSPVSAGGASTPAGQSGMAAPTKSAGPTPTI